MKDKNAGLVTEKKWQEITTAYRKKGAKIKDNKIITKEGIIVCRTKKNTINATPSNEHPNNIDLNNMVMTFKETIQMLR